MAVGLKEISERIVNSVRPSTAPVAVRVASPGEVIPQKAKVPTRDLGHPIAVCQAITLARTIGWSLSVGKSDHGCPVPPVLLGLVPPEPFLEGGLSIYYQEDREIGRLMESAYPRRPQGSAGEVWVTPLDRCEFVPEVIVVYGNPAQILSFIHAANFRRGTGVKSQSTGRFGCAAWLAGAIQSGECTYLIPGPGERVFAGTQDHEVSFVIPFHLVENFLDGLDYVRRKGAYRYPVPNLSVLGRPMIPKDYFKILPDKDNG